MSTPPTPASAAHTRVILQVSLRRMAAAQASPAEALLRSQVQGSSQAVQYPFVFSQARRAGLAYSTPS